MVVRSLVVASVLLQLTVCTRPPEPGVGTAAAAQKAECDKWFERQNWPNAWAACERISRHDKGALRMTLRAYSGDVQPKSALKLMDDLAIRDPATRLQFRAQQHVVDGEWNPALKLYGVALAMHAAIHDWRSAVRDLYLMAEPTNRLHFSKEASELTGLSAELAIRAGDLREATLAFIGEGMVRSRAGDITLANAAFDKAEKVGRTRREQAWLLAKRGGHLLMQFSDDEAKTLFESALKIADEDDLQDIRRSANLQLARLYARDGKVAEAQRYLAGYVAVRIEGNDSTYFLIEGLIARAEGKLAEAEHLLAEAAESPPDKDYAWDVAYTRGCIAEDLGDIVTAELRYREAIDYAESVRAKMSELALRPAVLERRRAPYEALLALYATHDRKRDALEITELLHARALSDAAAAIAHDHALPVTRNPGSALLAASGDREALVFVRAKGQMWRFHVRDRDVVEVVALPELASEIVKWRSQPEDAEMAARLGAALLPSRLTVAKDRPLYVVAPELGDLPFAALRRNERYLIEQRELVRLPGLVARCRAAAPADGPPVIVADSRGDLAAAREEASYVASLVGSVADIGGAATRDRILKGSHARLLFVAAHARVGERGGSLILQDGDFTAEDILKHGVAPRVAVLAGCATGDSPIPEGWGALSSSLLAAGTRSVVATLRPVADTPTSKIMRAFFDAHGDTRPSAALAAAQRANLAMRTRDWASFAVWGAASPDECQ